MTPDGLLQPFRAPNRMWEDLTNLIEGLPPAFGYNAVLAVVDRLWSLFAIKASL